MGIITQREAIMECFFRLARPYGYGAILLLFLIPVVYGCVKTSVMVNCGTGETVPTDPQAEGCPPPTAVTTPVAAVGTYWRLASNSQPTPAGSQCTSGSYCQGLTGLQKCAFSKPCYNWLYTDNHCMCGCNP